MERSFVMLTFDLEEFDIPEEYGQGVSETEQMQVTLRGMENVLSVLDAHHIRATFFTTGHFAAENPALIRHLAQKHEIASHALVHSPAHVFRESDIMESRSILEAVSGQTVNGFRMPRLKPFDRAALRRGGFRYDSDAYNDDLPYFTEVKGKQHLIVPYSLTYNDVQFALGNSGSPNDWFNLLKSGFDYLWDEGATHPKMMSIGLHPRWIGQAGRTAALRDFIDYVQNKGDAWIARRIDIADHWWANHDQFTR